VLISSVNSDCQLAGALGLKLRQMEILHVLFKSNYNKLKNDINNTRSSVLAAGDVIEEDHLSVFLGLDLHALGTITRGVLVGVNINDFPVTLVSEK